MPQNLNEPVHEPLKITVLESEWKRLEDLNEAAKNLRASLNCFFREKNPTAYDVHSVIRSLDSLNKYIKGL